jgi:putative ABC transport system permease protein
MLHHHFKVALRNLLKHRSFTLINILGLSVALAACLVIFFYILHEFSYEKNWKGSENIYRISYHRYQNGELSFKSAKAFWKMGRVIKDEIPGVKAYTEIFHDVVAVNTPETQLLNIRMFGTDSTFTDVFKLDFIQKKGDRPLVGLHSSLISESAAKSLFGDANALGKWFKVNRSWEFEVTGVYKDMPQNSHFRCDLLLSVHTYYYYFSNKNDSTRKAERERQLAPVKSWDWGYNGAYSYLLFEKNVPPAKVEKQINNLSGKYLQKLIENDGKAEFFLQPIRKIHLNSHYNNEMEPNGDMKNVIILSFIAVIILVIAWINFINLALARALERTNETMVRKTMGAMGSQIINQYLIEYSIINIVSLILALIIAFAGWTMFGNLLGITSTVSEFNNPVLWLILLIMFVAGIVVSGFYPAFLQSVLSNLTSKKITYFSHDKKLNLSKILVIGQFLASIVLIIGVITVYRQISFMRTQDLGIGIDNTLVTFSPMAEFGQVRAKIKTYKTRLLASPEIESVTTSSAVPGCDVLLERQDIRRPDDMSNTFKSYCYIYFDEDFIDSYKLKLLEGRNFTDNPGTESKNLIINESAAKQLGYNDARSSVNSFVLVGNTSYQIIGVLKDFHQESLKKEIRPIIFFYGFKWYCDIGYFSVRIRTAKTRSAIEQIKKVWQETFPLDRFEYTFLRDTFNMQYRKEYQFGQLFALFTLLAIVITSIGLYGLTLMATLKRTKEVGVRKINGATSYDILILLLRDYAKWVVISFVLACPLSFYIMQNWLENFAYRTSLSWWIFVLAGILSMLISVITISAHAWRVALRNPVDALRNE